MAKNIKERYNALPYGFYFTTNERGENDLDSHQSDRSNMYYLGGEVFTLDQMKTRNNPDERILIRNMECNNWNKVIINTNSWKWTQPLQENDIVLDMNSWDKQ